MELPACRLALQPFPRSDSLYFTVIPGAQVC